jgi:hypothetical protein
MNIIAPFIVGIIFSITTAINISSLINHLINNNNKTGLYSDPSQHIPDLSNNGFCMRILRIAMSFIVMNISLFLALYNLFLIFPPTK